MTQSNIQRNIQHFLGYLDGWELILVGGSGVPRFFIIHNPNLKPLPTTMYIDARKLYEAREHIKRVEKVERE